VSEKNHVANDVDVFNYTPLLHAIKLIILILWCLFKYYLPSTWLRWTN